MANETISRDKNPAYAGFIKALVTKKKSHVSHLQSRDQTNERRDYTKRKRRRRFLATLALMLFFLGVQTQVARGSRKFLTGLIIGTLLSRNGVPQGPAYPLPAPNYPGGSHGHQQPLFIIIPSNGKPSYRSANHQAQAYAAPPSYAEPYPAHHHQDYPQSYRRISLARRLGQVRRRRRPISAYEHYPSHGLSTSIKENHRNYATPVNSPRLITTSAPAMARMSMKLNDAKDRFSKFQHQTFGLDKLMSSIEYNYNEQVKAPTFFHR